MFEYLDVITQSVLQKMSNEALYQMTIGKVKDYPLFARWMDDSLFWSELCKKRFGITPYDQTNAKQFFQSEYLFTCQRYQDAAAAGSFRALLFLHKNYLSQNNYLAAIKNDEAFIKHYGLTGAICCCETYQLAVHDELTYAEAAIKMLNNIKASIDSPLSAHYLKELGWEAGFKNKYKDASTFIEMNRDFFNACLSENTCSIKP